MFTIIQLSMKSYQGQQSQATVIPHQNKMLDNVQHNCRVLADRNQFEAC